jgi:3-phenylpropionate/trans-cinnamate dioxygenase ferredoxin component
MSDAARARDDFEPVASVEAIPEGGLLAVRKSNGESVCLFKLDGEIGAVHDCCTHADFSMSEGELHADGTIECVWHGARFDCWSGVVKKGPADEPLPVYQVEVRGGQVHVGPRSSAGR